MRALSNESSSRNRCVEETLYLRAVAQRLINRRIIMIDTEKKQTKKRIYLSSPTMHGEEQQFVTEAFDTNWVAPLGPNVNQFEAEMAA